MNKAFRVLTEIVAFRDPTQCLPMVQYAAELNDNIGKFTFLVTYQYDMKFHLKKQIKPSIPWNVINNHLWSKCFSGTAKDLSFHTNSQQGGGNFHSQRTCNDFNFRSCTRAKCKFQHKCSKCYKLGTKHSSPFIHNFKRKHSGQSSPSSTKCSTYYYKTIPIGRK